MLETIQKRIKKTKWTLKHSQDPEYSVSGWDDEDTKQRDEVTSIV